MELYMAVKKIRIQKELLDKANKYYQTAGYSSVEEFISHILEKEFNKIEDGDDSLDAVKKRLQGLGYIS
jgi:metal-responsive CopG/Arc/MetJ family transcriptional regulator